MLLYLFCLALFRLRTFHGFGCLATRRRGSALIVVARCTLAELGVALESLSMADAVALEAVVTLAVAAFANWIVETTELLCPCKHC